MISLSDREASARTQNPEVSGGIRFNSKEPKGFPKKKVKLTLEGVSEPGSYEQITPNGKQTLTEDQYVSWFSDQGKFELNRTDLSIPVTFEPEKEKGILVAVIRNGRGGMAVLSYRSQ
jgi:hypothetical protein